MPTVLHVRAADRLATFTTELLGLLHQRGEALAGRVAATGRGAAAEFADFLMLQAINRYEPLLAHFAESGDAASRAAVSSSARRRPESWRPSPRRRSGRRSFLAYRHERLRESFEPVIAVAARVAEQSARRRAPISIPIEPRQFGISVAIVADRSLYGTAVFILAARADVPSEELRRRFPAQLKIGPAEKIGDLVRLQLPGVPVHAVPVAPRQIPYHAGFAYFELDQTHDLWAQLKDSGWHRDARGRRVPRVWRWNSGQSAAESGP